MATLLEKCNNIKNDKELNLKPENLKAGVTCLGVTGTLEELDTSDATATASDIADGKTAYVNGELITGNVFTVGSNANYGGMGNLTVEDDANYSRIEVTHNFSMKTLFTKDGRASFYPSYDSVAEAIGLTANQILKGNTILGVEGIAEAGDNNSIKVFNTEEEMRAVEDGQEGDLAIIYGRRWTQMSHNLAFNAMEFPETIELTEPMPDWAGHFYLAPAVYETENSAYVIANYEPSTIVVRYATSANAPEEVFITYTSVDGIHFNADRTDNRILNLPNDVMATSLDVWILDYNKIAKVNAKTADIYMFYEDYGMTGWKNISNTTNAQEGLDTSDATAMPENLMQGYSAYAKGQKIEGTLQTVPVSSALMVNGIQVSDFEATVSYEVPETKVIEAGDGFWASVPFDVITSQQNIMPDQIVEGYRILGIDGTARLGYDTSDADAMAENIEPGYSAYTRDGLVYGNMNVAEGMTFDSAHDKDKPEYRIFYDEPSNNIEQIFRNDNKVLLVNGTELDIRVSGADIIEAIGLTSDQILAGNTVLGLKGTAEIGGDPSGYNTKIETVLDTKTPHLQSLITELPTLDLTGVLTLSEFFEYCQRLENIDFSNNNTEELIEMYSAFNECTSLRSVSFENCNFRSLTSLSNTFGGCSSLEDVNFSVFEANNIQNMQNAFYGCSSLQTLDLSRLSGTVDSMHAAFRGCSSLRHLDISELDLSSVNGKGATFDGIPSDCFIYVRDLDAYNFVLEQRSDLTNVQTKYGGGGEQ